MDKEYEKRHKDLQDKALAEGKRKLETRMHRRFLRNAPASAKSNALKAKKTRS